ncbi:class I SAM-dependent methyltransferase [Stackebrandtia soli]|uniref:class I SAM-dependent methyltransferase n=1 Tax=Stackebrandtia soli TaxID=1892856 RepID=UPI0039EC299B
MSESAESWRYGELATAVYELDKPVGFSFGDIEFYGDRLADVTGPILEPAVGTGRFLIPLLEAGFDMRGFDASPHMLRVCQRNCAERNLTPELTSGDMETHVAEAAYDAIVIPTGSIMLLSGWGATVKALRHMRRSLRPGGRLLVDVPPLDVSTETGPIRHWWRGEDLLTLQTWHVDYNAVTQRVTRWQRYELWQNGSLVTTELQLFALQCFGLAEFAGLLREAGFRDVTAFGGYEARPPHRDDSMWTFEAMA